MSRRLPIVALVVLSMAVAAGCGAGDGTSSSGAVSGATAVPTIPGVGIAPDTVSPNQKARLLIPSPVNVDGTPAELLGGLVEGNRVLVIGDSIMASTSSRYGGQMCDALMPLGWQVAIEAEPSRFIDFGNRVLARVLDENPSPQDDWNAAVVFLGSNYNGDELTYEAELTEILDRLAERPTLLFTVTEFRPDYVEVNEVVRRLGAERDNVTIIDWQQIAESPGVLSSDRLHPTDTGREVLADTVAAALGPVTGDGDCLPSVFRNDSAIDQSGGGGSSVGSTSSGTSSGSRTTTTTIVRRPTNTTTTTTSAGGDGDTGVTTSTIDGGGVVATTTSPPTTVATSPPTTSPPTSPPTTAATTVLSTPSATTVPLVESTPGG